MEGWVNGFCHSKNGKGKPNPETYREALLSEVLDKEGIVQDSKDKFKNPEEIRSTSEKRTQPASAQ